MTLCDVGSATSNSPTLPKLIELMLFSFKPPLWGESSNAAVSGSTEARKRKQAGVFMTKQFLPNATQEDQLSFSPQ
jgi:hypothetical protein